jgi:hypothetical protein
MLASRKLERLLQLPVYANTAPLPLLSAAEYHSYNRLRVLRLPQVALQGYYEYSCDTDQVLLLLTLLLQFQEILKLAHSSSAGC